MKLTITTDGDEISTVEHGIEDVDESIESAVPAPDRFGGTEAGSAEDVPAIHDAEPAPSRFRPSPS